MSRTFATTSGRQQPACGGRAPRTPVVDPGGNPFHYVVVHVDGAQISLEVIGVDWGRGFAPYQRNTITLPDNRP